MKRKSIAMLLTAAMALTALTGCQGGDSDNAKNDVGGGSESGGAAEIDFDEEPYEATFMYWVANDARDVDSVEAAFNELTMAQLNMKVDLQPVTFGGYTQQIQMILSSDDKLDIFPIFGSNAGTYINADYVEDLSHFAVLLRRVQLLTV